MQPARPVPGAPPQPLAFPSRAWSDVGLVVGIAAVAFLVRLVPVLVRGDLLGQFSYDDGVYFGSAVAFVHGRLPYDDFLLLHPPGILLALAPFAALTDVLGDAGALGVARVATMLLGVLNVALVVALAGTWGRTAGICAGLLYAVIPPVVTVERTTWLIAPQSTLLLLAMLVLVRARLHGPLGPRGAAAVGALVGGAFGIQVWTAAPGIVLLGWVVVASRGAPGGLVRPVLACVVAGALVAGAVWLPFLLADPAAMVGNVVLDQLGRASGPRSLLEELSDIDPTRGRLRARVLAVAAPVLAVVGTTLVLWAVRRRPLLWIPASVALAQVALLLIAPAFTHYLAWPAPAVAVCLGVGVAELAGVVARGPARARILAPVLWAGYGLGLAGLLALSSIRSIGRPLDVEGIRTATAGARCIAADSPVLLLATDLLDPVLHAGCPLLLDPSGHSYELGRGLGVPRGRLEPYQRAMAEYYGSADAALFVRLESDVLSDETWAAITARLPNEQTFGPVTVLSR